MQQLQTRRKLESSIRHGGRRRHYCPRSGPGRARAVARPAF
jgi:hypothetical protein